MPFLLLSNVFEESTRVSWDDIASGLVATAELFFVESWRGMMYVYVVLWKLGGYLDIDEGQMLSSSGWCWKSRLT